MGFGMGAMVVGFMAVNSADFGPWYPWSLTLHTLSPRATMVIHPTVYSAIGAAVITVVGAWQFSRRDVA
jgi:ABC-2 type transport system permease protein